MSKKTIAILFIIGIVMGLVGTGLIIAGIAGSTVNTVSNGYSHISTVQNLGNGPLFAVGVVLAVLAGIPYLIAWIGALVNLGRLQQWVWFILVFIFHGIGLLVYLITGPTTPAGTAQTPQYTPRTDPPQQPSQNYPS